jgi:hypothetical protein
MGKAEKTDGYGKWTYGAYKVVNGNEVIHVVSGGVLTKQAEVTAKARELGAVIPDDAAWHCERDESDQSGRLFYITGCYKLEDIALPIDIGPFYHRIRKLRLSRLLIPVGTIIGIVGSVVGIKLVLLPAIAQVIILGSCAFFFSIVLPFSIGFCCAMNTRSIIDDTGAEVLGYLQAPLSKELSVRCRSLLNKVGIHVRLAPKGWAVTDGNPVREHAGTPTAVTREQWIDAIDEQVESWFESPLVTTRMITPMKVSEITPMKVSEPTVSPASVADAVNRILPGTPVNDTLATLGHGDLEATMKRVRSL